jgi:hypothetical protein
MTQQGKLHLVLAWASVQGYQPSCFTLLDLAVAVTLTLFYCFCTELSCS